MSSNSKVMKKELLITGGTVSVDEYRVRLDLPTSISYNAISSAVLNGGCQHFDFSSSSSSSQQQQQQQLHVINYKVLVTYDGINPEPVQLLKNFAAKEEGIIIDPTTTRKECCVIGLLTAASMQTFATSTKSAKGVHVDVIVTAGLSNSRKAGAEADYFVLDNNVDHDDDEQQQEQGTINTIVITNAELTPAALVEAYAIAIEAKCAACADHGVCCAKDSTALSQGTGTDCCVLLSPTTGNNNNNNKDRRRRKLIKHSGKHTLFAEMIGQAVYEATSEAIMINIRNSHGNFTMYTIHRLVKALVSSLQGARPCIPPKPMMPIPSAPSIIIGLGVISVFLTYSLPIIPKRARLLLGAVAWDRYLGEPPLKIHPVCLAGSAINGILSMTPEICFKRPVLGFLSGLLLLASMLVIFISGAWLFLEFTGITCELGVRYITSYCTFCNENVVSTILELVVWIMKLLLFKSTFSIQLLCTIALQMAKFLEREQLDEARVQLSWLCSRDPSKLHSGELAGATLESLAENLSDGFVAPVFWYIILGPLGALGYRVVNTLDSRVGYRGGKFEWFGKASARFDDVLNWIPARITAILLAVAAAFAPSSKCSFVRGLTTAWKDCNQCDSPNAGWPMACMAGLLNVRLEKKGEYCLGGLAGNIPCPSSIRSGHAVAQIASGMTLLAAVAITAMLSPLL